uniref:Uncharacterized protein n=1 Tax=Rhizophora mucronata TaxID=61149 RepID=A0A2P2P0E1_RHIMU
MQALLAILLPYEFPRFVFTLRVHRYLSTSPLYFVLSNHMNLYFYSHHILYFAYQVYSRYHFFH